MSKATDDLINRVEGSATALLGVQAKLSPQPQHATVEVVSAPPPPKQGPSQEDYAYAKQVIADMKGQLDALEAEVSRESGVPSAASPSSTGGAEEHKSKSK